MNLSDYRAIKSSARSALRQAGETPKKLVLVYAGVSCGVFLVTFLINLLLMQQIENTGGLGGIQTRSILSAIQVILRYLSIFFMIFWQIGFIHVTLRYAKGQQAEPKSLLEGLHHPGSVLGVMVMQSLIMMALAVALTYLSVFIYAMTPLSMPLYEVLEPIIAQNGANFTLDAETMTRLMGAMWPAVVVFGVLFLALGVPLMYRFRMARYCLMDDPANRTFGSVHFSVSAMKKNRVKLLKLDLSFWWYYVLQVLVMAVGNCDLWLARLGVPLPVSPETAYVIAYVLYLVLLFGLTLWAGNYVQTSYAQFYLTLKETKLREQTQVIVQNQPWDNPAR